jgi:hypothetical protein
MVGCEGRSRDCDPAGLRVEIEYLPPSKRLHAPHGWFILPVGVYRTPPVRGRGGAHLSQSCCGNHTDLSSALDADTGAC